MEAQSHARERLRELAIHYGELAGRVAGQSRRGPARPSRNTPGRR